MSCPELRDIQGICPVYPAMESPPDMLMSHEVGTARASDSVCHGVIRLLMKSLAELHLQL